MVGRRLPYGGPLGIPMAEPAGSSRSRLPFGEFRRRRPARRPAKQDLSWAEIPQPLGLSTDRFRTPTASRRLYCCQHCHSAATLRESTTVRYRKRATRKFSPYRANVCSPKAGVCMVGKGRQGTFSVCLYEPALRRARLPESKRRPKPPLTQITTIDFVYLIRVPSGMARQAVFRSFPRFS